MFYLILAIVILALALYMKPNETKAGLKWGATGVRGVTNDIQAVHLASKEARTENPTIVQDTIDTLNKSVIDTAEYHRSATKRRLSAEQSLALAMSLIKEEESTTATK